MKDRATNVFTISTPSQMINAIEFIQCFDLMDINNLIIVTCNSDKFIKQIKEVGNGHALEYNILFSPSFMGLNQSVFNRMPLKLVRLYISKKRISKLLKTISIEKLILGNYSNFISQYCTQYSSIETYVLDDGTGTILVAKKRMGELNDGVPIFDYNYKKKALWLVKLLMGFYKYRIPSKLTFFSSYDLSILEQDGYVRNNFDYLKKLYLNQKIDKNLEYFIGSPISEVGYVTKENEIGMIMEYANNFTSNKLVYIPHRLDSDDKLNEIKKSMAVIDFDLPIEFALSQKTELPGKIGGFFTSALPNLAKLMINDVSFFALNIPNRDFLTENMKNRATEVYNKYETIKAIKIIEIHWD